VSAPSTRPDRARAKRKREAFLNTGQASEALGGIVSAGLLRQMALSGEIPGAIRVRQRVLIPRRALDGLVVDLEFNAELPPARKVTVIRPLAS